MSSGFQEAERYQTKAFKILQSWISLSIKLHIKCKGGIKTFLDKWHLKKLAFPCADLKAGTGWFALKVISVVKTKRDPLSRTSNMRHVMETAEWQWRETLGEQIKTRCWGNCFVPFSLSTVMLSTRNDWGHPPVPTGRSHWHFSLESMLCWKVCFLSGLQTHHSYKYQGTWGQTKTEQKQALLFTEPGGYMARLGPHREAAGRESGKEREGLGSTFIGVEDRRIGLPGFTLYWWIENTRGGN